jgi:ribonuclease BN (tRNA processing enzyme)
MIPDAAHRAFRRAPDRPICRTILCESEALMNVLITGVGDAFTTRHYGSSAVIEAPDGHVMIDCPDPIHRVLREASSASGWDLDVTKIHDLVITHLHGDHCNGLESFGFYRRFASQQDPELPRPRIHAPQPVVDRLWEKLAPAMDFHWRIERAGTLDDYFEVHVIDPDHEARIAGLVVRCRFTGHPIPTVGLLLSDGAAVLGWSGDTPFEQAHVSWLDQAKLIVHESNFGPAHTPIESLNDLPDSVRAKLRLIHLPDGFDESGTDLKPLREGEVLEL